MARPSRVQQFEKQFNAEFNKKEPNTFKGLIGEEKRGLLGQLNQALKPGFILPFDRPTRNHAESILSQEMVQVCSRLYHGLRKLAGDATMDENGSPQPFMILIEESRPDLREKIYQEAQKIIRDTKLGLKGPSRMYRALLTGDAIGQPVFSWANDKPYLSDVVLMPTYEMHYDQKTGIWQQIVEGTAGPKVIYTWDNIPNFMVRTVHDGDDSRPYGRGALLNLHLNYRQYIAALEDLFVACRTRAPRRLVHYLGSEDGTWRVDRRALAEYKRRNELGSPRTIYTDYYVSNGFERIEDIPGDAAGVGALLEVVQYRENVMLEDLGLPTNMQDLAGRNVSESVDASYASTINILRAEDSSFITDVVKRGLLVKGFSDIPIEITIPPLGESASVRWERIWKAAHAGDIDYATACGLVGLNNPYAMRARIMEDMKWIKANPQFLEYYSRDVKSATQKAGLPGTEAPRKGADSKKGEQRRVQQKKAGKKYPSGA